MQSDNIRANITQKTFCGVKDVFCAKGINVVQDENGKPLFSTSDVANLIDDKHHISRNLQLIDEGQVVFLDAKKYFTEFGLYQYLLMSKKEKAKSFRHWVYGQLVEIREKVGFGIIAEKLPNVCGKKVESGDEKEDKIFEAVQKVAKKSVAQVDKSKYEMNFNSPAELLQHFVTKFFKGCEKKHFDRWKKNPGKYETEFLESEAKTFYNCAKNTLHFEKIVERMLSRWMRGVQPEEEPSCKPVTGNWVPPLPPLRFPQPPSPSSGPSLNEFLKIHSH